MPVLDDLIDGASGDVPVTTLLRKVKIVAARADVAQLDAWVGHELDGYPDGVAVPDYRGPFSVQVLGHFAGPFGSALRNAIIAPSSFPEDLRDGFSMQFVQPIATIEELTQGDKDTLNSPWPADVVAYTNMLVQKGKVSMYDGYGLQSAWRVIPRAQFVAIVDSVRTRILDLALELEKTAPKIGQAGAPPLPESATNSVVNIIHGGSTNIAVGSTNVTQTVTINPGDREALNKRLTELGVPEPDIEQLHAAIKLDGEPEHGELGPETSKWVVRVMPRIEGLGIGTTGGMLANLLGQFLGIS